MDMRSKLNGFPTSHLAPFCIMILLPRASESSCNFTRSLGTEEQSFKEDKYSFPQST